MTQAFVTASITIGVALFAFGFSLSLWSAPTAFMVTGALTTLVGVGAHWYRGIETSTTSSAGAPKG